MENQVIITVNDGPILAGYKGEAAPSSVPPSTGSYWYRVFTAGTYTNFGGIVVTAEDLDVVNGVANNRVILEVQDGVATKRIERVKGDKGDAADPAKLPLYSAIKSADIVAGTQFIDDENGNVVYRVKTGQTLLTTDIPINVVGTKVEVSDIVSKSNAINLGLQTSRTSARNAVPSIFKKTGLEVSYQLNLNEIDRLTITAPPTVSGDVLIKLNGVSTAVNISTTTENTPALVAAKIASSLTLTNWDIIYSAGNAYVDFSRKNTDIVAVSEFLPQSTNSQGNFTVLQKAGITLFKDKYIGNNIADWTTSANWQDAPPTIEAINLLLVDKVSKNEISQSRGSSTELIMSQKAVTDSFTNIESNYPIPQTFTLANAYIADDGTESSSPNWRTNIEYLNVVYGDIIYYVGATNLSGLARSIYGYNDAMEPVAIILGNGNYSSGIAVQVPKGVTKVKASSHNTTPLQLKKVRDFSQVNAFTAKKHMRKSWAVLGHSIWSNDRSISPIFIGYQKLIKQNYLFNGYFDYSYSGNSLGATSAGDTASLSLNIVPTMTADNDSIWTIDTITNDFRRDIPIGIIDDYTNNTGALTFYGALRIFKDRVAAVSPNATVICSNALKRNNGGYTSTSTNAAGHKLTDYEFAMMTIAKLNDWYFVDQYRMSGITDESISITTTDGLHLNDFGYRLAVLPWIAVFEMIYNRILVIK